MAKTKASALLKAIKCYALWAFLGSAVLLLVLTILETWEVITTYDMVYFDEAYMYGSGGMNGWGKIEATFSIIMAISFAILLTLLISSRIKSEGDCCCDCGCDCCRDGECCKDTAKVPMVMAAPKVAAKASAPKKAAPKK